MYYGQWFHPLREALQAFVDHASEVVTGTVKSEAVQGTGHGRQRDVEAIALRHAARELRMKDYDVTAARGFIDLFGLPMKVRGIKQGRD